MSFPVLCNSFDEIPVTKQMPMSITICRIAFIKKNLSAYTPAFGGCASLSTGPHNISGLKLSDEGEEDGEVIKYNKKTRLKKINFQ